MALGARYFGRLPVAYEGWRLTHSYQVTHNGSPHRLEVRSDPENWDREVGLLTPLPSARQAFGRGCLSLPAEPQLELALV